MSIPPGIRITKKNEVPLAVRLTKTMAGSKYAWLHLAALELTPGQSLLITFPEDTLAKNARQSLEKYLARLADRTYETWLVPGEDGYELWLEYKKAERPPVEQPVEEAGGEPAEGAPAGDPPKATGQNGHTETGVTTYVNVHGETLTHTEMRELLRNKRVVPRERFVSSRRGPMIVVDRNGKLVLEVER